MTKLQAFIDKYKYLTVGYTGASCHTFCSKIFVFVPFDFRKAVIC